MVSGANIKAVDIKPEQIADCRFMQKANCGGVKFELADLTQFQENEKYDLILSVDVMEHIEEDVLVFQEFLCFDEKRRSTFDFNPIGPGRFRLP